jgi:hypothetical protein
MLYIYLIALTIVWVRPKKLFSGWSRKKNDWLSYYSFSVAVSVNVFGVIAFEKYLSLSVYDLLLS